MRSVRVFWWGKKKNYLRQVCWSLTYKLKNSLLGEQASNFSIPLFPAKRAGAFSGSFLEADWLVLDLSNYHCRTETKNDFFFPHENREKCIFHLKKKILYLYFCYKTENREIMEMSAVTKNKGKRGLRANKRHLWFEWIRSCQGYISNTGEKSKKQNQMYFVCMF